MQTRKRPYPYKVSDNYLALDGIILMGPFGSGKSYLGRRLRDSGIASYIELEPIIYGRFDMETDEGVAQATAFIRKSYYEQISKREKVVAFESTGVVQRPLLLEMMSQFNLVLVYVQTPKAVCLERVANRNKTAKHPIDMANAENFYTYWTDEIAPTYTFGLIVNGTDADDAIKQISDFCEEENAP